jgi:hypothetical protein
VTLIILVVLVAAWSWWGFVTWRDHRRRSAPSGNSIQSFSNHLTVLGRATPVTTVAGVPQRSAPVAANSGLAPLVTTRSVHRTTPAVLVARVRRFVDGDRQRPLTLTEARQRRRQVLQGIAAALTLTVLLALFVGGIFVVPAVLMVAVAVAYVGLLARSRSIASERERKVHALHGPEDAVGNTSAFHGLPDDETGYGQDDRLVAAGYGATGGGYASGAGSYDDRPVAVVERFG